VQETLLAIQIERRFTKPQIFTLYANQIFLGHGAYGYEAASEYYFSKPAKQLKLEEAALLAGLPKAPQYYSPVTHPDRALKRRNLVLNAMLEDGKITAAQAAQARSKPIVLDLQKDPNSLAPHYVEEIRRYLEAKYGSDQVHESGLRVYTSLDTDLQKAARQSLLDGLAAYERRHGWRGKLANVIAQGEKIDKYADPDWDEDPEVNGYTHALVAAVSAGAAEVHFGRRTPRCRKPMSPGPSSSWPTFSTRATSSTSKCSRSMPTEKRRSAWSRTPEPKERSSPSITRPEKSRPWLAAAISISRNSTAPRRLCARSESSFKPYVYTAVIDQGGSPDDRLWMRR